MLKYDKVAQVAATIMFVAFCFMLAIYFLQKTSKIDQAE